MSVPTRLEQMLLVAMCCTARVGAAESSAAASAAPADTTARKAALIFRFDDVGAYSARSKSKAFALDQAVLAAFAERDLPLVVGVVPCSARGNDTMSVPSNGWLGEDRKLSAWLAQCAGRQRLEIAQHGVTHQSVRAGVNSEFRGVSFGIQRARILAGKRHLELLLNRPVQSFVPPWNDYDETTLLVLRDLGFACISDDWKGTEYSDVVHRVPQTATLAQLPEILKMYARIPARSLIVVLFHRYDFAELDDRGHDAAMTVPRLKDLLEQVSRRTDLECMVVSDYAERFGGDSSRSRYRTAQRYLTWASFTRVLPWGSGPVRDHRPGVFFPESYYDEISVRAAFLGVATGTGFAVPGALCGCLVTWALGGACGVRGRKAAHLLGVLAAVSATAIVVGRLGTGRAVGARAACACVFVLAFCVTCLLPARRFRQPEPGESAVRVSDKLPWP